MWWKLVFCPLPSVIPQGMFLTLRLKYTPSLLWLLVKQLYSVWAMGVGTGGQAWARPAPLNAASQLLTLIIAPGPPAAGYGMVLLNLSLVHSWNQSPLAGWCSPHVFWAMGSSVNPTLSTLRLLGIPQSFWGPTAVTASIHLHQYLRFSCYN